MSKPTTVKEAIKNFETEKGVVAANEEKVLLFAQVPPIEKMDATLSTLKACKHLSLSTNNIEKISSLSGMDSLMILSLGKNLIKKIENLDGVADTLEELWISYNLVEKLANFEKLTKLRVLYMSNNKVASMDELNKLGELDGLRELLLVNNPIYSEAEEPLQLCSDYRVQVLKRVPQLVKLDGIPVDGEERELAKMA
mmetsp:Transcript_6981/g.17377  ORF Transcript_6981/g.17377 Transcript_6981/m.17377 type:complete len:197 (-) Transcript_6981:125-715(-)|eukprot:CAMPEP_0181360380 /NCGR_PEP_ID=MMETSP1106-20121128/6634_1 /TAXON_ID=81844 /ORGANISM="Mantoniella antarctica, Strain SL-175" /LENGTH=196 /DNA_ID=CAMNT_0023473647 /DNA_START=270 /DNA_END=860 /DNA_ORIENTATION=-